MKLARYLGLQSDRVLHLVLRTWLCSNQNEAFRSKRGQIESLSVRSASSAHSALLSGEEGLPVEPYRVSHS